MANKLNNMSLQSFDLVTSISSLPFSLGSTFVSSTSHQINLKPFLNFPASTMLYIPDQEIICIGGHNGTISLLDANTFECLATYPKFSQTSITSLHYYQRKRLLIVFSSTVQVAKIQEKKNLLLVHGLGSAYTFNRFVGLDKNKGTLLTHSPDYSIKLYSLSTLSLQKKFSISPINVGKVLTKSLYVYIEEKGMLIRSINEQLEAYDVFSGIRIWTHYIESEIMSLNYSERDMTIIGLTCDSKVILGRLALDSKEVVSWDRLENRQFGSTGYIMDVLGNGLVLVKAMGEIICLNIEEKESHTIFSGEGNMPNSVIFACGEGKVFVLDWTKAVMRVILIQKNERQKNSVYKVRKWIDNWFRGAINIKRLFY